MVESLESLFTNEEYEEKAFRFGDANLTLKVLTAASTDYDLTGQVLWPAASLLSEYLARHPSVFFSRKAAVEIGSGVGLVGLLSAQFCSTVLTDHNKVVLRVLQQNAAANIGQHSIRCELMDWELEDQITAVRKMSPDSRGFDLVLGADICYGLRALPYIFKAYAHLLSGSENALGLLGYVSRNVGAETVLITTSLPQKMNVKHLHVTPQVVCRAAAIDRGIHTEANAAGLDIREAPGSRRRVEGGLEGAVFELRQQSSGLGGQSLVAVCAALLSGAILLRWRKPKDSIT